MAKNIKGIIIELGAETKGLDKALADVNKQSRDIQKELREVNKLLKFNPKDTELLSQKQKLLGDQVAVTKEKLDKLKAAQDQVKQQYEKGEIDEGQYRAFQREIVETESKLKHYEEQLKQVNKENDVFAQKMDAASKKLKDIGGKMQDVGKNLSLKVTAPIAAVGTASTAAFKEVDDALDTIVTKTGATGEAMDGFEENFRNVAKTMPVELQSVGDAIGEVNTQFGFTGETLEKASEQMLKFAEINGQDVTSATIESKNAIEAFGLSAEDLDMVLDSVTQTAQNTGVGTDKLFDSVVRGAPQLKALGLDFAQATEVMGSFEQKGIDSSKALSYMSKAQVTFAKEGKTLGEGLAELTEKIKNSSSETEQLTLASEYFGTKGATFMLDAINRGALDFDDFAGAAENAAGSVSKTFEGTLDPIDNFQTAMNNLKLVGADISTALQETLAPMMEKAVEKLQEFSDWFKELNPQTKEMIVKIGLAAAAIGPLLVVGGKLATGIGSIIDLGLKLAPVIGGLNLKFLAIAGPIAAAIAAGVLLYKNWDTIKEKARQLKDAVGEKWDNIKTKTSETWENIRTTTQEKWDDIKQRTTDTAENIRKTVGSRWDEVKAKTSDTWENMKTNTADAWSNIKSTIEENGGGIEGILNTAVKGYASIWQTGFNLIDKVTGGKMSDIASSISVGLGNVKSFFNNLKLKPIEIPKPKLPHFSISGEFSLKPPSVPKISVDWYAKGAIFNAPSVIGVGEAGPEAVVPIEKLGGILADTLKKIDGDRNLKAVVEKEKYYQDKGITQHIIINSPTPLTPSETARQVKNASRNLALEW
jgi:phage-related minor tail protein